MKKLLLVLIILSAAITQSKSQNDLGQSIQNIGKELKQIKTIDFTIDQSISRVSGTTVKLDVRKTDSKGKSSSEAYKFSLADINTSGVKEVLEGKIWVVELPVIDNDRYVEHSKGGEVVGYENKFRIDVNDIDNARALADVIKKAAAEAAPIEQQNYNYTTLEEILAELSLAVKPNGDVQSQKLKSDAVKKEKLNHIVQKAGKVPEMFEFNLSDLNPGSVEVKVFMKSITVTAATNADQKVVKVFENDLAKTYIARVTFFPSDIENAKRIKKLLGMGIQATKGNLPSATVNNPEKITESAFESASAVLKGNVPVPDFSSRPYLLTKQYTLQDLERTDASTETKAKNMGYGGMETSLVVFSQSSSARLKQNNLPKLIIKIDGNTDPSEMISVAKGEIKKGNRSFIQGSSTMKGEARDVNNQYVNISFKKVNDNMFEIIFPDGLQPGEYAFIANSNNTNGAKTKISCFGID